MRASTFARLDRAAAYDREPPARRLAVIVSTLFLLSLGTIATMTSGRAGAADPGAATISVASLSTGTAH